jgi:hypothetical protein
VILPSTPVALSDFTPDRIVSCAKLELFANSSSVTFCMVCTNLPASISALVMVLLTLLARVELVN